MNQDTAYTLGTKLGDGNNAENSHIDPRIMTEGMIVESYAPSTHPVYLKCRPCTIHRFTDRTHPVHSRKKLPVEASLSFLAKRIVDSLWCGKFANFNHFQSQMLRTLSHSDDNIVVSAPTGAGKTTIFEMAIARFLSVDLKHQERRLHTIKRPGLVSISHARKIVYIAPSKALCNERYTDWSRRLENMNLGLTVSLITGQEIGCEHESNCFRDTIGAHLIVTTPEKWDSMTRRWKDNIFLFASVKLLLLDEAHLLGDESRGWCLESVLTRMKTIQRFVADLNFTKEIIDASNYTETNPGAIRSSFRVVALSATLPNISDISRFLDAHEAFTFDDSYRPVSLTKHVNALGKVGGNEWKFWSSLNVHVPEIIKRFSHGKQSIIFCHSKKETHKVTELLIKKGFGNGGVEKFEPPWKEPVEYMLRHGIAYHHAGMSKDARTRIEQAFLNKKIRCLASTSTLAVGVNLPAHLVIVVGTKAWRSKNGMNGYQDITVNELHQMIGRAGRPGLDSTGVAVIMTDNDSKTRIERHLESGTGPVTSCLCPRLPQVMNTEISLGMITSKEEAVQWIKTTFLFACMMKRSDALSSAKCLVESSITNLRKLGVIKDGELDVIHPLPASELMNKRSLSTSEMRTMTSFPFNISQCQILRSLSKLDCIKRDLRRNEMKELREFHRSEMMKYKLPGLLSRFSVKDPSEKAFILLQSYLSRHIYEKATLNEEQIAVSYEAIKFLDAAQEYSMRISRHGKVLYECYKLMRSFKCHLWGESSGVLNQLDLIGASIDDSILNALTFHGIRSFHDVLDTTEERLENLFASMKVKHMPKDPGRRLKNTVSELCHHRLKMTAGLNRNGPTGFSCTLSYYDPITHITRTSSTEKFLKYIIIAYTDGTESSCVLFEQDISSPLSWNVPLPRSQFEKLHVHLMGTWIGFDQKRVFDFKSDENLGSNFEKDSVSSASREQGVLFELERHCPSLLTQSEGGQQGTTGGQNKMSRPTRKDEEFQSRADPLSDCEKYFQSWDDTRNNCPSDDRITENSPQRFSAERKIQNHISDSSHLGSQNSYSCGKRKAMLGTKSSFISETRNLVTYERYTPEQTITNYRTTNSSRSSTGNFPKLLAMPFKGTAEIENFLFKNQGEHHAEDFTRVVCTEKKGRETNSDVTVVSSQKYQMKKPTWKRSREMQNRAQQRAFIEKSSNPFNYFSHDPNDSESFLEKLSRESLLEKSTSPISSHLFYRRSVHGQKFRKRSHSQKTEQVMPKKVFERKGHGQMILGQDENPNDINLLSNRESSPAFLPTIKRNLGSQEYHDQDIVDDFQFICSSRDHNRSELSASTVLSAVPRIQQADECKYSSSIERPCPYEFEIPLSFPEGTCEGSKWSVRERTNLSNSQVHGQKDSHRKDLEGPDCKYFGDIFF